MRPNQYHLRHYVWNQGKEDATKGIALFRRGILLHLTVDEAINLANQIVDTIENEGK